MHSRVLIFILIVAVIPDCQSFRLFESKPEIDQSVIVRDDKGNVTDAEIAKIKKLVGEAEAQYNSTDISKIAKYVSLGMKDGYQFWNTFVYDKNVTEIGITGYLVENKWVWLKNVGKYGLTYALITIWVPGTLVSGGQGTAVFGEDVDSNMQQQMINIVNNSISYKGDSIQDASLYIYNKTFSALKGSRWFNVIARQNTTYGYYRSAYEQNWANFRAYGDFKWNYYIWLA